MKGREAPSGVAVQAFVARAWLRRSLPATALLTLLVMVAGGVVLASFVGARRSASVLERFLDFSRPADVQVSGDPGVLDLDAVESLPQVIGSARGAYGLMTVAGPGGGPFKPGIINPFIAIEEKGVRSYRPLVVEGREPATGAADEVTIDAASARRLGAGVGDVLDVQLYAPEQIPEFYGEGGEFPDADGERVRLVVTGIVRHLFDLNPVPPPDIDAVSLASAEIHLPPAFWAEYGSRMAAFGGVDDGTEILLAAGQDDMAAFRQAVQALPGGAEASVEAGSDGLDAVDDARQTVRFEAVATALFGVLLGVTALAIVGQVIARQVRADLSERDLLAALGFRSPDLGAAAMIKALPVATLGGGGAVAVAWLLSPLTPIGFARQAEVAPGPHFDAPVLLGGALLLGVAVVAWSGRVAWRRRQEASAGRRGLFARASARTAAAGAPVGIVVGLAQLAQGRGERRRLPMLSSLGSVAVAVVGLLAAVVFAASLDGFVRNEAAQGWTWDLIVGEVDDEAITTEGGDRLRANPDVVGFAGVWIAEEELSVVGNTEQSVAVVAVDSGKGDTGVRVVEGRPARRADEIVLGAGTMERAGVSIGDTLELTAGDRRASFRVVGEGVLHELMADPFELDQGAVVHPDGLRRLHDEVAVARFLVDVSDDVALSEAARRLQDDFGPTVIPHIPPIDVVSLQRTRVLPLALAAVVGLLGVGALVHLLLAAVRRRRIELGVLRALGADRPQVFGVVSSSATAVAAAALLVGAPLGVVAGRWTWRAMADGMGADYSPVVPIWALLATVAGVLAVANLSALMPARLAARAHPAAILRAE